MLFRNDRDCMSKALHIKSIFDFPSMCRVNPIATAHQVDNKIGAGCGILVLWVTCGNTSNASLREILTKRLSTAIALLQKGEPLIEISDAIPSA